MTCLLKQGLAAKNVQSVIYNIDLIIDYHWKLYEYAMEMVNGRFDYISLLNILPCHLPDFRA